MWSNALLKGVPLMKCTTSIEDNGFSIGPEGLSKTFTDYIIQGQVISLVMGLVDVEEGWNGPHYVANHIYRIDFMVGSQLINSMRNWNGNMAFKLMSLSIPRGGEEETEDQVKAREIVIERLTRSSGFELAHGLILRVLGGTLGSLWRKYEESDNMPDTYAHWLRYGASHWNQDNIPPRMNFTIIDPYKKGPLLRVG